MSSKERMYDMEIKFIRFASTKGIEIVADDHHLSLTDKGLFTYMWYRAALQDGVTKADICKAHSATDESDFEASLKNLQQGDYLEIEPDHDLKDGSEFEFWILKQEPKRRFER